LGFVFWLEHYAFYSRSQVRGVEVQQQAKLQLCDTHVSQHNGCVNGIKTRDALDVHDNSITNYQIWAML
jgi:hypothetical protein